MKKAFVSMTVFSFCVMPVLANETAPWLPPSPPAISYEVRFYCREGQQYVKQAKYTYSTSDLKKASDYAAQINRFAGWTSTLNIPLNTQDMINTQNMVNNLQDMVNTQNMIDTQNMVNATQSNP